MVVQRELFGNGNRTSVKSPSGKDLRLSMALPDPSQYTHDLVSQFPLQVDTDGMRDNLRLIVRSGYCIPRGFGSTQISNNDVAVVYERVTSHIRRYSSIKPLVD